MIFFDLSPLINAFNILFWGGLNFNVKHLNSNITSRKKYNILTYTRYFKNFTNLTILFKFNVYIDRAQYTTKTFPSISVIKNFISVFEKAGSVLEIVHKPEKSKNQEETINQVKTLLTEFPSLSIQNMASAVHCFD